MNDQTPWMQAPQTRPSRRRRKRSLIPSLNFLLILLIFVGCGAAMLHGLVAGRGAILVLVLSGWVVSLCLHEFGHAITAYVGGDRSVARTGYLDLDPFRYSDVALSLILPLVFIVLGGFGLPGGAVWINVSALRSKAWAALVSAAGPTMNVVCLAVLAALYVALPEGAPDDLTAGLAVLAYFQATAVILNILPIPGLDGFGILRPWLSYQTTAKADAFAPGAFLILSLLLWFTSAGAILSRLALRMTGEFGLDVSDVARGFTAMRFF